MKLQTPNDNARKIAIALGAFLFSWSATGIAAANGFKVEHPAGRLIITHNSMPVAHFVFADAEILRPYFAHVHAPNGVQVTRTHPPVAGIDSVDHATMHPGVWLAFGNISDQDFWRNKASIQHEKFTASASSDEHQLTFATESTLISTSKKMLGKLNSAFRITSQPDGYLLIWNATITSTTDDFVFGDQEEMGFGARVATSISEKNGGQIQNSEGVKGAKAAWGRTAKWCDYSGVISNRLVGLTVMSHPKNFRSSWFHSRDYGLLVANPFGQKAFTNQSEASRIRLARGEAFQLGFAAFIHSTATNKTPDIARAYRVFTGEK
jgi:hypothetical protein